MRFAFILSILCSLPVQASVLKEGTLPLLMDDSREWLVAQNPQGSCKKTAADFWIINVADSSKSFQVSNEVGCNFEPRDGEQPMPPEQYAFRFVESEGQRYLLFRSQFRKEEYSPDHKSWNAVAVNLATREQIKIGGPFRYGYGSLKGKNFIFVTRANREYDEAAIDLARLDTISIPGENDSRKNLSSTEDGRYVLSEIIGSSNDYEIFSPVTGKTIAFQAQRDLKQEAAKGFLRDYAWGGAHYFGDYFLFHESPRYNTQTEYQAVSLRTGDRIPLSIGASVNVTHGKNEQVEITPYGASLRGDPKGIFRVDLKTGASRLISEIKGRIFMTMNDGLLMKDGDFFQFRDTYEDKWHQLNLPFTWEGIGEIDQPVVFWRAGNVLRILQSKSCDRSKDLFSLRYVKVNTKQSICVDDVYWPQGERKFEEFWQDSKGRQYVIMSKKINDSDEWSSEMFFALDWKNLTAHRVSEGDVNLAREEQPGAFVYLEQRGLDRQLVAIVDGKRLTLNKRPVGAFFLKGNSVIFGTGANGKFRTEMVLLEP